MTLRAVLAHASYRYRLLRAWDSARPTLGFVMLNPIAADAVVDVPTVGRCVRFAQTWGYGSLVAVNLFAYRTVCPKRLSEVADPIGPENDRHILRTTDEAELLVVGGDATGPLRDGTSMC